MVDTVVRARCGPGTRAVPAARAGFQTKKGGIHNPMVREKGELLRTARCKARDRSGRYLHLPSTSQVPYWFWPRLGSVEPDLLLLFHDVLVIVEAKYLSNKSGENSDEQTELAPQDQLAKEWRSCDPVHCDGYGMELRDAIAFGGAKRVLVYLVRQPTSVKTRKEIDASHSAIGEDAALYSLGWNDLVASLRSEVGASIGWSRALSQLLEWRGFSSFAGFPSLTLSTPARSDLVGRWGITGSRSQRREVSFPRALAEMRIEAVRYLSAQTTRMNGSHGGWLHVLDSTKLDVVKRLAGPLRWRPTEIDGNEP